MNVLAFDFNRLDERAGLPELDDIFTDTNMKMVLTCIPQVFNHVFIFSCCFELESYYCTSCDRLSNSIND